MLKDEIIEFGKNLVQNVRDSAIKNCDIRLRSNNSKSSIAKRWMEAKNAGNMDKFGEIIISDCVDDTLFYFLEAIDQGILNISLNIPNKGIINLTEEGLGELSGWYAGQWISEYSKERFTDDFSDIK